MSQVKLTSWRTPEMQEGYRWYWVMQNGRGPAGHWVAQVAVDQNTPLSHYLGQPDPSPVSLGDAIGKAFTGRTQAEAVAILADSKKDWERVRSYGWTRAGAESRALKRYRRLLREATMAEDTLDQKTLEEDGL